MVDSYLAQERRATGRPRPHSRGLVLASLLALLLLLVSLARVTADAVSGAFSNRVVASVLAEPIWHTRLGLNIALFMAALLGLHLAGACIPWTLSVFSERAFPGARYSRRKWILIWFLAGAMWLLAANAALFPHSALGAPYHELATARVLGTTPYQLATFVLAAAVAATLAMGAFRSEARALPAAVLGGLALLGAATALPQGRPAPVTPVDARPNVILLGIDSLRPDTVSQESTPNIRDALVGGVQLTEAITPLARTFPSWVSILTGRHPHSTGAYMNLLPREFIHTGSTLPEALRRHGYRTVYAIDETRFSNIDGSYGFDQTLTPSAGASDFVLSWFADTPLSNLLMNTRLGAVLFPHVHGNRAAHVTYDPDTFVGRIDREVSFAQPVFLAVHLTLPHWPYSWATSRADSDGADSPRASYLAAIRRVDQQFADVVSVLKRHGALDNALVVILSDHGQALGEVGDFLPGHFPGEQHPAADIVGHGTSVLSPSQYRVVLGFRAYGQAASMLPTPETLGAPVSLVDIAPTLLDLLGVTSSEPVDGQSLMPLLHDNGHAALDLAERIRFTESEYNPRSFQLSNMTANGIAGAARAYRLDPATDRVTVRTEMLDEIMADRQYAAMLGNGAMAAAIPGNRPDGKLELVYVPAPHPAGAGVPVAKSGQVETDLPRLLEALQERFGIRIASR